MHQKSFVDGVTYVKVKRDLIKPVSLLKVCHIEEGFVYGDYSSSIQEWRVKEEKFSLGVRSGKMMNYTYYFALHLPFAVPFIALYIERRHF